MLITDEHCFRDVGLRAAVKEILCESYSFPWLGLGLELVTGRTYGSFLEDNKHSLYAFIDNVLANRRILTVSSSWIISTCKILPTKPPWTNCPC